MIALMILMSAIISSIVQILSHQLWVRKETLDSTILSGLGSRRSLASRQDVFLHRMGSWEERRVEKTEVEKGGEGRGGEIGYGEHWLRKL